MERKDIVIINAWIDTLEKELDLINLIITIKNHFPVCVSSHFQISKTIQELADVFVYEKNNYQFNVSRFDPINEDELAYYYHASPILFFKQSSKKTCSFIPSATLTNNALNLCKSMGYTHCFFTEYDNLFVEEDMHVFYEFRQKTIDEQTNGCFIEYNPGHVSEPFWYVNIDYYLNNVPNIRNPEEFIQYCRIINETGGSSSLFFWSSFMFYYLTKNGKISFVKCTDNCTLFPNSLMNKHVKGKPYGYVLELVKEKGTENIYFCVDTMNANGIGLEFRVLSNKGLYTYFSNLGFYFAQIQGDEFYIQIFNNKKEKIEENYYTKKDILKCNTSYIEFKK